MVRRFTKIPLCFWSRRADLSRRAQTHRLRERRTRERVWLGSAPVKLPRFPTPRQTASSWRRCRHAASVPGQHWAAEHEQKCQGEEGEAADDSESLKDAPHARDEHVHERPRDLARHEPRFDGRHYRERATRGTQPVEFEPRSEPLRVPATECPWYLARWFGDVSSTVRRPFRPLRRVRPSCSKRFDRDRRNSLLSFSPARVFWDWIVLTDSPRRRFPTIFSFALQHGPWRPSRPQTVEHRRAEPEQFRSPSAIGLRLSDERIRRRRRLRRGLVDRTRQLGSQSRGRRQSRPGFYRRRGRGRRGSPRRRWPRRGERPRVESGSREEERQTERLWCVRGHGRFEPGARKVGEPDRFDRARERSREVARTWVRL